MDFPTLALLRTAPTAPHAPRPAVGAALRAVELARQASSDTLRAGRVSDGAGLGDGEAALDAALRYLERTHDATCRRGSSRGYSLLKGWADAFPETTGYIIGTLLAYALPRNRQDLVVRAREMADWELEVQGPEGGIIQGLVTNRDASPIAFNTGMVMHGWLDLHAVTGDDTHLEAARRGGEFLVATQDADGAWRGRHSYAGIPHTYKSRVAWALLKLGAATGDGRFTAAAVRNLDWVVSVQRPNGWFEHCRFEPGSLPNTHGLAYTMRGLVEAYALLGDERYLRSAQRCSGPLIERFTEAGTLTATWRSDWTSHARYRCLTGLAQLGGVWLRVHELSGAPGFREAGLKAVEHAAAHQLRGRRPELDGALPGSFPIYGRYAPLACPNWATKFLADSLMIRSRVLDGRAAGLEVWG